MKNRIINSAYDPNRFEVLKDGFIRDHLDKIDRGPDAPKEMTKKEAIAYCKSLGCRLETVKEQYSLIDCSKINPAVISIYPGKVKSAWYWAQEKYLGYEGASFVVSFCNGRVDYNYEDGKYYVRPCRASQ